LLSHIFLSGGIHIFLRQLFSLFPSSNNLGAEQNLITSRALLNNANRGKKAEAALSNCEQSRLPGNERTLPSRRFS